MERRINIKNKQRRAKSSNELTLADISSNWVFKIFSVAISAMLLFSVINSVKLTMQKLEILRKAEQEVEDLRLTNLHLSVGIKEMSTDRYLEKEARDRLNFGGVEEVVFVIPENALEQARERVDTLVEPHPSTVYKQGSNIGVWRDFVILGI